MAALADPEALAAMAAGDPAGLEAVYRRYADRLYAYARSLLRDADTAADVVQETFVIVHERVTQLRDPARLSSWLYSIVRNECLARLRARKRTVLLAESDEPILDTDPGRAVHAQQVRELVHAAAAGMNDPDREVFELTVRHGMAAADVARVLDISDKHAHARISRVRDQFEGALGALVLARDARGRCEELDAIVDGWDGQLTALLRKRIDRHARDCAICVQRRRERMDPAGLLAAYAGLPFLAVPVEVWHRLHAATGSALPDADVAQSAGSPAAAGGEPTVPLPASAQAPTAGESPTVPIQAEPTIPLQAGGGGGRGRSGDAGRGLAPAPKKPSTRALVLGAAAAVLLIIGCTSAVALLTLDRTPSGVVAQPSGPASSSPAPSQSPAATTSPTPAGTSPPAPPPPPPFSVSAEGEWVCGSLPVPFEVVVQANRTLAQATVHWRAPAGSATAQSKPMTVDGQSARLSFVPGSFVPDIRWWVVATAASGASLTTTPVVTDQDC